MALIMYGPGLNVLDQDQFQGGILANIIATKILPFGGRARLNGIDASLNFSVLD